MQAHLLQVDLPAAAAALFAALACALLGNFLVLRRQSLMSDAISHSLLPGVVLAFMVSGARTSGAMFLGAAIAAVVTVALVQFVRRRARLESGAAMGVVFSIMFAAGVVLIEQGPARNVDLDADCVLYGQLEHIMWLAAANPGGSHEDPAAPDVEGKLNNPDTPRMERLALTAPDDPAGKAAVQATIDRIKAAVEAGIMPNDFEVSKQTVERQDRARTTLWKADNSNFEDLKNIKVPVLITDGRSDELDRPKNSLIIANQIPFSWLAYFWGGHSFLYTEPKRFADTVNVFLQ